MSTVLSQFEPRMSLAHRCLRNLQGGAGARESQVDGILLAVVPPSAPHPTTARFETTVL
jgi:hypothetical protein